MTKSKKPLRWYCVEYEDLSGPMCLVCKDRTPDGPVEFVRGMGHIVIRVIYLHKA